MVIVDGDLYARAAQFADCGKFTPPDGTRFYLFSPTSPAERHFGPLGNHDGVVGGWGRGAILAQPGDYLTTVWDKLRGYWLPSLSPKDAPLPIDPWQIDNGLDAQLAFTNAFDTGFYHPPPHPHPPPGRTFPPVSVALAYAQGVYTQVWSTSTTASGLHMNHTGLRFLRDWQQVVRFRALALSITTLLVLLGLLAGDRRSRVGILLFGVNGLSLIVARALTANFLGRYTIPMAGPLTAAGAIAAVALWRLRRGEQER